MHDRRIGLLWIAAGLVVPVAVAAALIPARDTLGAANIALVLVVVVVAIAASGNRWAASLAAVTSALSFDFLHTEPYGSFTIAKRDDIVTFVCLLIVGLTVAQIAAWAHHQRRTAERTISDVSILRSIAELTASGEDPEYVVITAAYWLRELLNLRDCRFEYDLSATSRAQLTTSGEIKLGDIFWDTETSGMPDSEIELIVRGKGQPLGRFVLSPTPIEQVTPDRLLTAVALADQVGVCLAGGQNRQPSND